MKKTRFKTPYGRRLRERRRSAAKRLQLRLQGLTCKGAPRRSEIWPKHLFMGCRSEAERKLVRQRITRQRNLDAGLRYDGKPRSPNYHFWPELARIHGRERNIKRLVIYQRRRRAEKRLSPLDRAWRSFRQAVPGPNFLTEGNEVNEGSFYE